MQTKQLRREMVERQLIARGIRAPLVLEAMTTVPREAFVPERLVALAHEDSPLPIDEGQTISQPYIVALMAEALELRGGERVLEVGTGSGYAAAVLSEIAAEVYSIERIGSLAERAAAVLADRGYRNVHVRHADGTRGWPEHAPYDAIVVAAGGPEVPDSLKRQLAVGGRLVVPVGPDRSVQELVRVTRTGADTWRTEELADVRFVPLVGAEGWDPGTPPRHKRPALPGARGGAETIAAAAEPFGEIAAADLDPLLDRIGDARVVLIGEATHGTSEFYWMRELITRELVIKKGFSFVAIEGDWPDAARIDHYVRHAEAPLRTWTAFARFPVWMWRNAEVRRFVDWLRGYNADLTPAHRVAFYGLDLYSLYTSIHAVVDYLDRVDAEAARTARTRYGCLAPWQSDPATYGHAAISGHIRSCEDEVVGMLRDLLDKREAYLGTDGERFLDAVQNAQLVANAERYYRAMYYGSRASWNLRDSHMFATLKSLLGHRGPRSKAVVWAHNSHVGDASATEMARRGEHNLGQLCRREFGREVYAIGFGTDSGTVAAAAEWDGAMQVMPVRPALAGSIERLCHDSGVARFFLALRGADAALEGALGAPLLQRAIGVIYRPETERASHYFRAALPSQFDEYIWIDRTSAVRPLGTAELKGLPETYPFGL